MKSVQMQCDIDRGSIPQKNVDISIFKPEEVLFANVADRGSDSLLLEYESSYPVNFFRDFLASIYAISGGYCFQIHRPKWFIVDSEMGEVRYDSKYSIVAYPRDNTLEIALVDYIDEPSDVVPVQWRTDSLIATVSIRTDEYVAAVIDVAEVFVNHLEESAEVEVDQRILTFLQDAKAIKNCIDQTGDATQYRLQPDSERVQVYLYDNMFTDVSLTHFLIKTGVVRAEVERLHTLGDEDASKKYKTLLSHDSRQIQQEVAEVLAEQPDERALEWLLGRRWTDRPEIVEPALRGAAKIGGQDVRDALCDEVDFSSHAQLRLLAVELLADYADETTIETLETVATEDEDDDVRAGAREVLAELTS